MIDDKEFNQNPTNDQEIIVSVGQGKKMYAKDFLWTFSSEDLPEEVEKRFMKIIDFEYRKKNLPLTYQNNEEKNRIFMELEKHIHQTKRLFHEILSNRMDDFKNTYSKTLMDRLKSKLAEREVREKLKKETCEAVLELLFDPSKIVSVFDGDFDSRGSGFGRVDRKRLNGEIFLTEEGEFRFGQLHGYGKRFDDKGVVIEEGTFQQGILK